ncbi:DNA topoisomerase I [Wenzhouxiangella sp. XN201]|uniref:DNA topoisomerase I n=1 Tax=Wenzhouxiangella sp. XN201 TaxID=2710755 RepID=UPI0013CA6A2F|nr:DNA topoisomerase I [Wenzhouxiangella sp. XN201]NEZ04457.1 DNA topoisomerase I [Wenzhouxiangella sp. XN201]
MSKNLLIVESPAKATTINKYLGPDFQVLASYGHVRDLVPKEGAVDTENNFEMRYEIIERNKKHVDKIVAAAKKADAVYLATDLDREGEAISWHIAEILKQRGVNSGIPVKRVVFSEITERAIKKAMDEPRDLAVSLVDAQQARRALDYLVGFNLSPLLWKKVRRGLSAGRVQSPALRMIAEREEEIEKFDPQEYWTIEADLGQNEDEAFNANLVKIDGNKLEQFDITAADQADKLKTQIEQAADGRFKVARVKKSQRRRRPQPPFITSTLQQEAARRLRFTTQRTMRLAQQLYEGVDTGSGTQGLITYMRTDSVALAGDAISEIRQTIASEFGEKLAPEKPNFYQSKSKNAQEAHEAVRPTSAKLTPIKLRSHLSDDQYRLYELIWNRTMASQMIPAVYDTVSAEFDVGDTTFRASGSTLIEPGFLKVYRDARAESDTRLPEINEGDEIPLIQIRPEQHFTEPPPRYSEASLVKALEEHGIGRPSTYASIIQTLKDREYVELENRRFTPTSTGRVVAKFLSQHFERYVDYDFTARLEDELDAISRGEHDWVPLLKEFWQPFIDRVREKDETVSRKEAQQARELGTDPKSGKPVIVRLGRYGPFAQIGSAEDDEKPEFAGLRPGQKMDKITLEEALELFKLPRHLGETSEGEPVQANIGRFGPYVRYGQRNFVSLKEHDPHDITLDQALELVAEHKQKMKERIIREFSDEGIQILKGRYGPFVTDGKRNASVPKDVEPENLTLEECQKMLAEAPPKGRRGKFGKKKAGGKKAAAKKAGKKKASKKKKKKKSKKKKAAKKKTSV